MGKAKPDSSEADDDSSGKVRMCHKGGFVISIASPARAAHEAHGDWVVDDENPCPAEGAGGISACLEEVGENPVLNADILLLESLNAAQFDLDTGLLYLPQVQINILGIEQTLAVILERVNDTDFLLRYSAVVDDPAEGVIPVLFDGTATTQPFDSTVVPDDAGIDDISAVEFSVLPGCDPIQLSVTNFTLESS